MITTVCLNPAYDKTVTVDRLCPGEVNRLQTSETVVGGKGINVAIVLERLSASARCVACISDADEAIFTKAMAMEAVALYPVRVKGSVRTNLKIVALENGCVTECNEQGAEISDAEIASLMQTVRKLVQDGSTLVLSGSLPRGCPKDIYGTIIKESGAKRYVVDTSGDAMRGALPYKPFLIKPNLPELWELTGEKPTKLKDIQKAAIKLVEVGAQHVAVSMGESGALLTNGNKTIYAPVLPVAVGSTVGAGDAMLAGILYGLEQGESVFNALRYGSAAGAASVQGGGVHALTRDSFQKLLAKATVTEL